MWPVAPMTTMRPIRRPYQVPSQRLGRGCFLLPGSAGLRPGRRGAGAHLVRPRAGARLVRGRCSAGDAADRQRRRAGVNPVLMAAMSDVEQEDLRGAAPRSEHRPRHDPGGPSGRVSRRCALRGRRRRGVRAPCRAVRPLGTRTGRIEPSSLAAGGERPRSRRPAPPRQPRRVDTRTHRSRWPGSRPTRAPAGSASSSALR